MDFCTLFDSNYLTRGIAMYESLIKFSKGFHLYILALDKKTEAVLERLGLGNITLVRMKDFEDEELLNIKKDREKGEYCWTCTPSIILYILQKYGLPYCTYLDADLYFFSDPQVLVDELGEESVSIIEHRYTKGIKIEWITNSIDNIEMENMLSRLDDNEKILLLKYYKKSHEFHYLEKADLSEDDKTKIINILYENGHNLFSDFGKYCVQFMTFKNDEKGMKVLKKWRSDCIKWCYAKVEYGKFGDQKYLDKWKDEFQGVKELKNPGGGTAPWNIQQYEIFNEKDKIRGKVIETGEMFDLVFYHFAALRFFDVFYQFNDKIIFKMLRLQYANEDFGHFKKNVIKYIYKPYIKHLLRIKKIVTEIDDSIDPNGNFKQYKFLENLFLKEKKRK
jgi:hypothetical protein